MDGTRKIDVIMATRNGGRTLPSVLRSYKRLRSPEGGWRLIVADNGSDDDTAEIVKDASAELPIHYVFESNPGKNAALNRALAEVSGDIVVFTDDDIFPQDDWLIAFRRCADAHPDFSVFAGAIAPRWETTPADWLISMVPLGWAYGLTAPELRDGPLVADMVFGGNMAIRATLFAGGLRFNERIGPRGSSYAMGSETELVRRLSESGVHSWWCQDAVVEHLIRANQLSASWVCKRAVKYGRGQYRLRSANDDARVALMWGIPRFLLRQVLVQWGKAVAWALVCQREAAFGAALRGSQLWGQVVEARTLHLDRRRDGAANS